VTGSKRIRPRCEFGHWPHTDVSSVASADLGVHHAAMARTSAEPGLHRRDPRRLVVLVGQRKALAIAVKGRGRGGGGRSCGSGLLAMTGYQAVWIPDGSDPRFPYLTS